MDLAGLFIGDLTEEQIIKLRAFQKAAEELGAVIKFGDLVITYYQGAPTEYGLNRTFRSPTPAAANRR
jgi:hypothetical protein